MKQAGEKIACLTCYDASFAAILEAAGVEVLLVGDSLGMVIQGHDSTLPVTVADMVYHTRCVRRANSRTLVIADMPFMSYVSPAQAVGNAARLMQEGGAHMVKLEGAHVAVVRELGRHGIPVCAHLGLLPQSVHKLGGYRVQGRDEVAAERMLTEAQELQAAGADLMVLESVPSALAERITAAIEIPTIGIGAGPSCDGQVLVLYDMLGITPGKRPRFSKSFLEGRADIAEAVREYVRAVKAGAFPGPEHTFT
jgi:3-methyl-2-oxobutanoate hydroxymethyltransferase